MIQYILVLWPVEAHRGPPDYRDMEDTRFIFFLMMLFGFVGWWALETCSTKGGTRGGFSRWRSSPD